jgi:hypothetical protein
VTSPDHAAAGQNLGSAHVFVANAGKAARRYTTAIDRYTNVIELFPTFAAAYHNCAIAYAHSGDQLTCQRDLLKALTLHCDSITAGPSQLAREARILGKYHADRVIDRTLPRPNLIVRMATLWHSRVGTFRLRGDPFPSS